MITINKNDANIIEIFSSVQGEGPYIGYRQLFIRFAFCNLDCSYCDTEFTAGKFYKIEEKPSTGIFKEYENPVNIENLVKIMSDFLYLNHHSISLTGGEPLLHVEFLQNFIAKLKSDSKYQNLKVYLETNGTLPDHLIEIINLIDIISMDIKLESSTFNPVPWKEHKEFLDIAIANNKEIFAKVVIADKITAKEIEKIKEIFCGKKIPVILQPVSSSNKAIVPSSKKLMDIQESLLEQIDDVRIIPQVHKYMNLL